MITIENALKIDGWMNKGELEWLATQAENAQTIIEIGVWQGRTTTALADNTSGIVYAVDHFRGSPELTYGLYGRDEFWQSSIFKMNLLPHLNSGKVKMVASPSDVAFTQFWNSGVRADFIFLDGSHHYMDVLREIMWYRQILNPGGIIAGHDFNTLEFAGVTAAVWDSFKFGHTVNSVEQIWWVRI